jgi:hypothetical protein
MTIARLINRHGKQPLRRSVDPATIGLLNDERYGA